MINSVENYALRYDRYYSPFNKIELQIDHKKNPLDIERNIIQMVSFYLKICILNKVFERDWLK